MGSKGGGKAGGGGGGVDKVILVPGQFGGVRVGLCTYMGSEKINMPMRAAQGLQSKTQITDFMRHTHKSAGALRN